MSSVPIRSESYDRIQEELSDEEDSEEHRFMHAAST
jgi:hypothetical protein